MKKIVSIFLLFQMYLPGYTQTNTFPATGNVGIGTTSPLDLLHANGNIRWGGTNTNYVYSGQDGIGLYLEQVGNTAAKSRVRLQSSKSSDLTNYSQFFIDPYNGFSFMTLGNANGNVGIGTSMPTYKLEAVTGGAAALRLQTSNSTVPNPQIDLYDAGRYQETVISSSDGATVGTYLASYSNHPLMFGTNHSTAQVTLVSSGNLGIGTINPSEKLSVNGNIRTQKLIVTQLGWSDYVFDKDYKLRSLQDLEAFIKENKHLPEVPSTKEVSEKGISVGDNQALLLKKIEELTLYVIELKKEINKIKNK
ncbi:hypothetical protein SAMN05444410_1048 [Hydrobacter penzbergensis]|uniref:Tail fiber domain-containing protein n=1 Tax=Hydrobacter penzbergensis TaxID=1235997 RepID=A0A8X8LAS1_9BACT|nr:hypothetical protein [Hydrobacter penzbergensis]SDW58047.1 hypothetical protein SAMN05444410_1048 [Hydrobacter penzbergensis]